MDIKLELDENSSQPPPVLVDQHFPVSVPTSAEDDQDLRIEEEDDEDDDNLPLDIMKLKELESKQNLRLYLMKSWNVMQSVGTSVPELSNAEIGKLLMSPPQSPSINSTCKEAVIESTTTSVTSATASNSIEEHLDSTNDSDTLVMALEDDHVSLMSRDSSASNRAKKRCTSTATAATTLKTLNSPLNDGLYTYWAVVKSSTVPTSSPGVSAGPNYLAKFNFNRYRI